MKISSTFTSLAMVAALTTGCGKEQTESVEDLVLNPITFSTVVGQQTAATTRAKEFGYWQPGETLDITSYMTGAGTASPIPFHLTYEGPYTTSWKYDQLIEVPNPPFSRTYYAWYPAKANITNLKTDGENGSFSYTVRDASQQEDLIAAKTTTAYARVPLLFHRLLSQINFAVQAKQGIHIDIQNIRLNNIANAADYTFGASGGNWSTATGSVTYPYTPVVGVTFPTDGSNSNVIYLGNKGGGVAVENSQTNALMLMPQSFDPAGGGNVTFDYALADMYNKPMKSGNARIFLGDFTTKTWEMGKRYLYLIDLAGLVEEGPITFEVVMFGWDDAMRNGAAQPVLISDGTDVLIAKGITFQNIEKAANPSLSSFPVALPNSPMTGGPMDKRVLKGFSYDHFVTGDTVRIICFSYENAMRISLDPDDAALNAAWTLVYPTDPGPNPDTSKGIEVLLIKN